MFAGLLSRAGLKFASGSLGCEVKPANTQQEAGSGVQGSSLTYTLHHALHLQVKTRGCEVLKATQLARAEQGDQPKTNSFF